MPAEHPLLDLLPRITAAAPTIRRWSQYWADANLLPLLRDLQAATNRPDLDASRLNQYLRDLRAVLTQRDDTRGLVAAPATGGGTHRLVDTGALPLSLRLPTSEVRIEVGRLLEALGATPPPVHHAPEVANPLLAELDSYGQLPDCWNGYSAAAPSAAAIDNARGLVTEATTRAMAPTRVEPSAMGGVGVTFASGEREVVVEFYNNGTAHSLFADNARDEVDTRPVARGNEGYRGFLEEVRQYIHG